MSSTVQLVVLIGFTAIVAGVVSVGFAYEDFAGLIIVGLAIVILAIILIPRLLPQTDRRFLLNLAILGFVAKMGGSFTRLGLTEGIWGFQDASRYHAVGIDIAAALRSLNFDAAMATEAYATSATPMGTRALEIITGVFYTGFGSTLYGGFLFFAFLAFIGALFFIKAFDELFEGRNVRFFAVLMFFYPSLLLWPSSLGKDAILFFFAGLATYGAVRAISRSKLSGLMPLVIGLAGLTWIRPHIGVIALLALGAALLVRNPGTTFVNQLKYVLMVGIFGVLLYVGYSQISALLDLTSISVDGIQRALSEQASNEYGAIDGTVGSNFSVTPLGDKFWLPTALVTVLFRPFPWEASSVLVLVQSGESMLLAALIGVKYKNVLKSIMSAPRHPLLVYTIVFILLNVVTLSTLGNFGLLSRQRALIFPFIFILVAAQWAADRHLDKSRSDALPVAAG